MQVAGVAAEEVEQVRDLQRHQVLRLVEQDPLPRIASLLPLAGGARLGGGDVAALAFVGVAGGRELGGTLQAVGGHEAEAVLGHRQERVGLHQVRQGPGRILGDRGVEVVQRIAVVRQHPPQRLLGMLERAGRGRADGAAASIDKGIGAALRGSGLGRDRVLVSHRCHCSSFLEKAGEVNVFAKLARSLAKRAGSSQCSACPAPA